MKLVSKMAAFGVAAALSATGLVAASGVSADAATGTKTVTYNCDLSGLGQGTKQVTTAYSIPALPTTLVAGKAVPATPISAQVTLPAEVSGLVVGLFGGKIGGTVAGDATFGSQVVGSSLTIPETTITDGTAPATVPASGSLASFTPAAAGVDALSLPSKVKATFNTGGQTVEVPCAAVPGSNLALGSVTVTQAKSLSVKAPKHAKLGHVLKLKVTTTETGKAVAKIKGKKVAKAKVKKNGKATLKIKKGLKKGKNKIVVSVGSLTKHVKVKVK